MLRRALLAAVAAALLVSASASAATVQLGSCLWQRNDPVLVNALYPDADAAYYTVRLPTPPPGVAYRFRGSFPHARYMSFVSYDGLPVDALLDADIPPEAGSSNPFVPGARRDVTQRAYTVDLLPGPVPEQRRPGALYVSGGQLGAVPGTVIQVIYRVYVPDIGRDAAGGVALPRIEAVGAPLALSLLKVPCPAVRDILQEPLEEVQDTYATTSLPVQPPATPLADPTPSWSVQSGLTAALLGAVGEGDAVSGGPASNPHNKYLLATISRSLGEVVLIRGKAPTTPATHRGEPVMGTGDLRYWSFCQNSRTTRYVACRSDPEFALDEDGWFTLVISDPAYRPPSAADWLPFGPELDGQILYRHMLPSAAFLPRSAQGVAASGVSAEVAMGDYYPRIAYCSTARFERDRCGG